MFWLPFFSFFFFYLWGNLLKRKMNDCCYIFSQYSPNYAHVRNFRGVLFMQMCSNVETVIRSKMTFSSRLMCIFSRVTPKGSRLHHEQFNIGGSALIRSLARRRIRRLIPILCLCTLNIRLRPAAGLLSVAYRLGTGGKHLT